MVARRLQDHIRRMWPAPWQFQVLMTLWWLVWGGVKLWLDAWEAVLALVRRSRERGEPSELARKLRWGVPGTAQELMEAFWRSQGVEPPQELLLLHEISTQQSKQVLRQALGVSLAGVLLAVFGLIWPPLQAYRWALDLLPLPLVGMAYWILRPGVWRTWLAYLYGVDTWDMRLIVRLCRRLGMREPARVGPRGDDGPAV